MPDDSDSILKKFEGLAKRLDTLERQNKELREENQRLKQENDLYRQKIDKLIRHRFGRRSEMLDSKQLELLLKGLEREEAPPPPAPQTPRRPPRRKSQQPRLALNDENLPVEEIIIEPAEVLDDPEGWTPISEERTSQLDWIPAQVIKRVFIRPRYVRKERFAIAQLPPQPIDKGMVGPGLLSHILINKYDYHQPLYRQEKIFLEQHGLQINRKTMGSWMEQCAELLKPVYLEMGRKLAEGDYLQIDETPIRYLDPDSKGKSRKGWLWAYGRPGGDLIFEWEISRSREGPSDFLKDFKGTIQSDGYGVYESVCRGREDLELVGCWAHARRDFFEVAAGNRQAAWLVGQIRQLYAVEKALRQRRAGPALREATRRAHSQPVLDRLFKAMELIRRRGGLPEHPLNKAIDYVLRRKEQLSRFVSKGHLEIDNNLIENAIRPSALGKKNWLFVGHPGAGWRSAVFYSLLGSCRRHGVNPHHYLKDLLTRLPAATTSQIPEFTPSAWAKARRAQSTALP